VIYLGPFQTADTVVGAATTEDVDVVAISNVSGEYMVYVPELLTKLRERDLDPVVIIGGLVPDKDKHVLLQLGVDGVFGQGSTLDSIVDFIRNAVAKRSAVQRA